MRSRLIFSFIVIALFLLLMEAFTYLFFSRYENQLGLMEVKTPSLEALEQAAYFYDKDLGWTTRFNTSHGERNPVVRFKQDYMSAFGDSFTYCDDVADNETWEYYLSLLLKKNIYNFGVGGYGTGQAFLRFKKINPKTRIVVMGLTEENINRVVNIYRPFYITGCGYQLTKPRFLIKDGKLFYLQNPIRNKSDLSKLEQINFIKALGKYDYWYHHKVHFSFPYSKIYLDRKFWHVLLHHDAYGNLWNTSAAGIVFKLMDNFVGSVNTTPVFLILPSKLNVVNNERGRGVKAIMRYCKIKGYICFDTNEALANSTANKTRRMAYFKGHVSPLGNRVIAETFYRFLNRNNLT